LSAHAIADSDEEYEHGRCRHAAGSQRRRLEEPMTLRSVSGIVSLVAVVTAAGGAAALVGDPPIVAGPPARGPLFAALLGSNEIDEAGRRAGDIDGRGAASLVVHDGEVLCFAITVTGIDTPVAAHVHAGTPGENGPIVIPLVAPPSGDPGVSGDCVAVDPELLEDILQHPAQYYVNVHTAAFPGGALRGQLFHHLH
jgi:hypothetical protein